MIEYITDIKFKDSKDPFYIFYGFPSDQAITQPILNNFPTFLEQGKDHIISNLRTSLKNLVPHNSYVVSYALDVKDIAFKKIIIAFLLMKERRFINPAEILEYTDKSLDHFVKEVIPILYQDKDFEVDKKTEFSIKLIGNSSLVNIDESLALFEKHFTDIENKVKVYAL